MTIAPEQNSNEMLPPKPELSAEEALAQLSHNTAEERPATEAVVASTEEDTPQRAGFSTKAKVAAAVGAGLLAATGGGIAAGVAIANNSQEQVQENPDAAPVDEQPVTSPSPSDLPSPRPTSVPVETAQPTNPNPGETSAPGEVVVISPEISDPHEVVKVYNTIVNNWRNHGEDLATSSLLLNENVKGNLDAELDKSVAEAEAVFPNGLYKTDWRQDPLLKADFEMRKQMHRDTLYLKAFTIPEAWMGDEEVYKTFSDITEMRIETQEPNEFTVVIWDHSYDNSAKNRVGEDWTNGKYLDASGSARLKFVREDDGWKLAFKEPISYTDNTIG